MESPHQANARASRTRTRLIDAALELFERNGYDQTTAAAIAAAAGVTEMTFFRHFSTKDQLLLDDPYDPLLASAVLAQPPGPPLLRTISGIRSAWRTLPEPAGDFTKRRIRIVASTPGLRAAVARNNAGTELVIADALIADGTDSLQARVAVAAVIAAMSVALMEWSQQEKATLGETIDAALGVLDAHHG
ncbi:TetR/AcrR family transcriptional regulator [Paenarthrobacter sp. NPDC057355]|uniref:TetR/AcrR family transcriptional regulator n=1 Tax=Paenarthrobacter sp. NPDC057355 TaxID=3346105 RepID=UPI00362C8CB9